MTKNYLMSVKIAKRLAFAIALAGFTESTVSAQVTLPNFPAQMQTTASQAIGPLLPSLCPSDECAGDACSSGEQEKQQTAVCLESKLVGMLGLATTNRRAKPDRMKSEPTAVATVHEGSCASVVHASATGQEKPTDEGGTAAAETGLLFDFDLPIPGTIHDSGPSVERSRVADTPLGSEPVAAKPSVLPTPQVASKRRTIRLSIAPAAGSPPGPLTVRNLTLVDEVLEASLSVQPALDEEIGEAEFRFSDAVTMAGSETTLHGETLHGETLHGETLHGETLHGETLHGETLHGETRNDEVSAPDIKKSKPVEVLSRAGRMRVQIEGEPVMVVSSNGGSSRKQKIDVASGPKPTLEQPTDKVPSTEMNQPQRVHSEPDPKTVSTTNQLSLQSPEDFSTGASLEIRRQDTSSIVTEANILQYSVEHASICKLLKTGNKALSLVGIAEGDSRIAIITVDEHGKRQVEVRDVRVVEASTAEVDLRELSLEFTQTVSELYPKSQVEIVSDGEQLIVQGSVKSERDARKILSLIRKTALTPVVDRLQSY